MVIDTRFDIGDFVTIDGDKSIHARVTEVKYRGAGLVYYGCSWFSSGDAKYETVEEWRLSRREA